MNEKTRIQPAFDLLMDDDGKVRFELSMLAFNIKKEVARIFDSFLTFLKSYEEKKAHNMLSLMLDLRLKGFCLVSSYVGCGQRSVYVEEYDVKALYPMLLKCYHYLHPMGENESGDVVNHKDDDCKLNIFRMDHQQQRTCERVGD